MDRETLQSSLSTLDQSAQFLIAIFAGLLLSLRALTLQREQVCRALSGEAAEPLSVYPLRHTAGALTVGALGFFLCQAARTFSQAGGSGPAARQSARANLTASILVFAAAAIRLEDTQLTRCPAPSEPVTPRTPGSAPRSPR